VQETNKIHIKVGKGKKVLKINFASIFGPTLQSFTEEKK
jgi:hypothetical protein